MLGLVGGLLGTVLGLGLAQLAGRAAFGLDVPIHPLVFPLGLFVAMAVAAAGSWIPLRWALRVVPAEALKP